MRKIDMENLENIDLEKLLQDMTEEKVNEEDIESDLEEDDDNKEDKKEIISNINNTIEDIEDDENHESLYDSNTIQVVLQDYKELKEKYDELNDKYIRTMADFGNFRKRNLEENRLKIDKSKVSILKEVILLNDTFDRALKEADDSQSFENLYEGVQAIQKLVDVLLEKENVHPIASVGEKFNPELHDCVAVVPVPGEEAETIIDEIEKGYMINKTVIRPSKVVVAGGSTEEATPQTEETPEEEKAPEETIDNVDTNAIVETSEDTNEEEVTNTEDIGEEIPVNIN